MCVFELFLKKNISEPKRRYRIRINNIQTKKKNKKIQNPMFLNLKEDIE